MIRAKKILVASVGNILKRDDGLGFNVLEQLRELKLPSNVEILDLGVSGMSILQYIKGYDKVIFVDVIKRGGKPGSIYLLKLKEMASSNKPIDPSELAIVSMHQFDLEKTMALGMMLGEISSDITIIGCEPEDVDTLRIGLTDKVKDTVPKIIELLLKALNE